MTEIISGLSTALADRYTIELTRAIRDQVNCTIRVAHPVEMLLPPDAHSGLRVTHPR